MATEKELRAKLVKEAEKRIGETNASTSKKYNKIKKSKRDALGPTSPTCVAFISSVLHDIGADKIGSIEAYIPWFVDELKSNGAKIISKTKPIKVGDIIVFDWNNDSTRDHVGIVKEIKGNKIVSIEGNMSTSNKVGTRTFDKDWVFVEYYISLAWSKIATKAQTKHKGYTVKKGDTLSSIATKYGTTWQKLYNQNRDTIVNPNLINIGQVIKVDTPKDVYYTVKRGDTLSSIATKYNTNWKTLAKINKLKNPNLIHPGQKLLIK